MSTKRQQIVTLPYWCKEDEVRKKFWWIDPSYVCTVEGRRIETPERFLWQFVFEQRDSKEPASR